MNRYYYKSGIVDFLKADASSILGQIVTEHYFDLTPQQRDAWIEQTEILKSALVGQEGSIYFEFSIPRMGRRVDAVLLIGPAIFVVEFKVGQKTLLTQDLEQVMDYALDLTHFHEGSHRQFVVPVLVATDLPTTKCDLKLKLAKEWLYEPLKSNSTVLARVFENCVEEIKGTFLDSLHWEMSGYKPTPTIIAASGFRVAGIMRPPSPCWGRGSARRSGSRLPFGSVGDSGSHMPAV